LGIRDHLRHRLQRRRRRWPIRQHHCDPYSLSAYSDFRINEKWHDQPERDGGDAMKLSVLWTLGRAQDGAVLVEFALVAPVFLLLLFGVIEFGGAFWTQQALHQAAIVGARCMALPQSACASTVTYTYDATKTMTYSAGREPMGAFAVELGYHPEQYRELWWTERLL
jgi:hypothetical protein